MLPTSSPLQLRAELEDLALKDLLGPAGGPEEIVSEVNVRGRYIVGLLAPKGQTPLAGDDDGNLSRLHLEMDNVVPINIWHDLTAGHGHNETA